MPMQRVFKKNVFFLKNKITIAHSLAHSGVNREGDGGGGKAEYWSISAITHCLTHSIPPSHWCVDPIFVHNLTQCTHITNKDTDNLEA